MASRHDPSSRDAIRRPRFSPTAPGRTPTTIRVGWPARAGRATLAAALVALSVLASGLPAPAQAFPLQDESGRRADLTDRLGDGRWTLVMLWTTDCVPCEAQKPMIDAFHGDHVDHDAHVVGIALDGPAALAEIERIKARTPVSFPTLIAYDDVFPAQYETLTGKPFRATPTYLLFRPDGELLGAHVGPIDRLALERVVEGG